MSLNYNTELALINTTTNSGTITLPSATTVPGRVISFKDSVGNFNNKSLTLICDGSDTFEDGTVTKVLYESFGSIQVVASGTKWFILSGVKQNSMTISSLITSTISTYSISFSDGSFQTISADKSINSSIIGLGTFGYISTSQLVSTTLGLVDNLELNSSIRGLGSIGYLSTNTVPSTIVGLGTFGYLSTNIVPSTIVGLGTFGYISTSQLVSTTIGLVDHLELNSSIAGLGSLGYLSSFNSISSLNISTNSLFVNNSVENSISSLRISSGNLYSGFIFTNSYNGSNTGANLNMNGGVFPTSGTAKDLGASGAFRWNNLWVSTISSIHTQTSTLNVQTAINASSIGVDRITAVNGGTNTFTNNLFPIGAGAQLGFFGSAGTNSGGFYSQVNARSTITQVIVPDVVGAFSNNIRVQGNLSTQNIFSSTINSGTVTLTTGGFTQRVVSSAVAPSGTVTLNLTSGNVFFFTTAMGTSATANFTTLTATVGSTYYVNFLTGLTPGIVTFTGNTGATTLSITGLSLVGNPSVSIGLHGAGQSFTPAASTRYMFTCIAIDT